ncbi:ATP-grasp domain-containing protein [Streptomyces triticagri]|uniref:ATP-grasp domain-containing protein n=1 Tax=Streptomyces triticagri TaxID=2293568 RepID=A0A372LV43_9ACTN|nr:ATP-grasp domain-containing protein [Streptomyces triticagri]RFU82511.1 ATP-grasp domain-containing protein [Streptomyces triticagri]
MTTQSAGFTDRLRHAVTGGAGTPLVLLGNFEVENQWARGEPALPRVAAHAGSAVVNSMDEFALLLGGPYDHVVLKSAPDEGYRRYLESLGLRLPTVHVVAHADPRRTVTEDALEDPGLIKTLAGLAAGGARLSAHGVSTVEERLAEATGLGLAAPDAALCKRVNSKIYSRRAADELGLRQARGWACDTLEELADAVRGAGELLASGRKVVVKDAYGVSGKGIVVLDSEQRLARLHRMAEAQAKRAAADDGAVRTSLVIEEWVAKRCDLNYQFTVDRSGSVHFDFVKEALTEAGVHKGHRMPARLDGAQTGELREAARLIGERLAADGYFGVVGVDAMVAPDESLYPVLEINARNNMSTYQSVVHDGARPLAGPGQVAVARHYPVRLTRPFGFDEMRGVLDGLLLERGRSGGLFVNNYATVNAAWAPGPRPDGAAAEPFEGRLYGVLVEDGAERLDALDADITRRLADLTERSAA